MRIQHYNIVAFIFDKKGRIISIGHNSYTKTHPLQARLAKKFGRPERIYLHAEIHAIIKCKNLNRAYKIFVMKFKADGTFGLAKPCPICMDAIKEAGIKKVEWTK